MDRIVHLKDCVALLKTETGKYKIAFVTQGYRRDYPKLYKRYCDAEQAWCEKLGEAQGVAPIQR